MTLFAPRHSTGSGEPICAPLFFCQSARLAAHGRTSQQRCRGCSSTRGLEPCCLEKRRRLCTALVVIREARIAHPRNVELTYCAMGVFGSANPGVSRRHPSTRSWGEASPCLAPRRGCVQREGARRTRGSGREGTPRSPSVAWRIDCRVGSARRAEGVADASIPKIGPQSCARLSRAIRNREPLRDPSRKIPRRLHSA